MANHFHLIIVVDNPADVPAFVEYLKRESSHAVNRLLGRPRHTVWSDGYESAIILDAKKVISRIAYLYSNPAKADLVDSIDEYPHLSSWQAFLAGGLEISSARIPRSSIAPLPKRSLSNNEFLKLIQELQLNAHEDCSLSVEPDSWMQCFRETAFADPDEINDSAIYLIRKEEQRLREQRTRPVLGAHALTLQPMTVAHTPKKHSKRMLCLASDKEVRVLHLRWFRQLCSEAPHIARNSLSVDWLALMPPGLFAPGGALRGNINPASVPSLHCLTL